MMSYSMEWIIPAVVALACGSLASIASFSLGLL